MPTCHKDLAGNTCVKDKLSPQKSKEAELWLNMMTSMLNFAMASTTLMKSLQNRVEVTRKLEEEARAMRATEFFRQELHQAKDNMSDISEDFSLRSEPMREDTCAENDCTLLFRKMDECEPTCGGRKPPQPKKISPFSKKKKKIYQESVDTVGPSCLCLLPGEISEVEVCEASRDYEDEEPSCVCSEEGEKEENGENNNEGQDGDVNDPEVPCPANKVLTQKPDDCSCPSILCDDEISTALEEEEKEIETTKMDNPSDGVRGEGGLGKESSIIECGCQTTSSQELMIKELQYANLSYQMRQTDKNLKDLKKEMERITNFVGGKKKCSYATAAALYEEIMKPRTSLDESSRSSSRRRKR